MADQNWRNNRSFHPLLRSFCELLNAAFIKLLLFISCIFEEEELPAAIFPHAAFSFSIIVILGLLQVKYQGKGKSPFESHPRTIAVASTSLVIYGLAYGIQQRLSTDHNYRVPRSASNAIRCCMLLAGWLSLAASASFLFPDWIRPLLFVFYFIGSAWELLSWMYERCSAREHRETHHGWRRTRLSFINSICGLWARFFTKRSRRLPV